MALDHGLLAQNATSFRLPDETVERLKALAEAAKLSQSALIRLWVDQAWDDVLAGVPIVRVAGTGLPKAGPR